MGRSRAEEGEDRPIQVVREGGRGPQVQHADPEVGGGGSLGRPVPCSTEEVIQLPAIGNAAQAGGDNDTALAAFSAVTVAAKQAEAQLELDVPSATRSLPAVDRCASTGLLTAGEQARLQRFGMQQARKSRAQRMGHCRHMMTNDMTNLAFQAGDFDPPDRGKQWQHPGSWPGGVRGFRVGPLTVRPQLRLLRQGLQNAVTCNELLAHSSDVWGCVGECQRSSICDYNNHEVTACQALSLPNTAFIVADGSIVERRDEWPECTSRMLIKPCKDFSHSYYCINSVTF